MKNGNGLVKQIRVILLNVGELEDCLAGILGLGGVIPVNNMQDAVDSISSMVGPMGMLILGMLIAEMDLKKLLSYHRLWWITLLRLVGIPLIGIVLLKYSGLAALVPEGRTILLVTLLAICTPSASTLTQMAQVYGKDADYASAINVVTTLLCIVTMPLMVALYQM